MFSSSVRSAGGRSTSPTSDLKSLDDALKDAVKYVTKINEEINLNSKSVDLTSKKSKQEIYLSEHRILSLLKKCKNVQKTNRDLENFYMLIASKIFKILSLNIHMYPTLVPF